MKLLAIDGNSIMNRAYYGIRALTNKKGVYTNALFGFLNIYFKNFDAVKPDSVAVAFDLRTPTFRHKAVESYKANRKGMPEELAQQMPLIKEILTAMGVRVIECEGYEADDVLGTLSKMCADTDNECHILTGDRDSLQLVNDSVTVHLATTKETIIYTPDKFYEDYGFEPIYLIDLKALMGDSSDNISGVSGIGQKTATTLVTKWKTIENLYENLENAGLTKGAFTKLDNGREAAKESKWLATIVLDAPVDTNPDSYILKERDDVRLAQLLTELEMFKILARFGLEASETVHEQEESKTVDIKCKTAEMTEEALNKILSGERVVYMLNGDRMSVCEFENDAECVVYTTENKGFILEILSGSIPKITFAAKLHYHFAFENNTVLNNLSFDCEIAAYLLDPSASDYNIEKLCFRYDSPYFKQAEENAELVSLVKLYEVLKKEVNKQGLDYLMYEVEQPLTEVLASMEHTGIQVNAQGVKSFGEQLKDEIEGTQQQIYFMCGTEFNIASPKQLGDILYDMGVPLKKKNKHGFSTTAEILDELRDSNPIIDLVLRYRKLTKLNSTYVDGLLKTVSEDGRIHTVFRQTETRTGRISSTEPNLQNIPVRTELGREMRRFFTAADGKVFLDADYSQIELRIVAHICDDPVMINGFETGADIHASTAAQVFGLPQEMVTDDMRSAAKAVNFGIIYGIGAFSLSKDIGVTVYEAKKYIKNYFKNFPNIERFMDETVEKAKTDGYVTTMFGRKRYVPELSASNKNMQAAGRRIAMNTPIQGSAADIIKIAMVKVYNRLKAEVPDARLILQVHDELIVECDIKDADRASEILSEEMQSAAELKVPLTADVNRGESWYEAKG
ncbi:MAG: DNA polymerase I [Ruminococcus sp.]|nr:DNA polymerase I [Ruminococcus sp.]